MNHVEVAGELHRGRTERREVQTLSSRFSEMTIDDAYAVQLAGIGLREGEGETVIGGKLGFTSRAMQQAMGVPHPNSGWLTDAMVVHDWVVRLDTLIHPKVEPEIAFLLGSALEPPVSPAEVLAATVGVMPCLEVVDSRYEGFRFGPLDNIADNSSAGRVVLGDPVPVTDFDLGLLGVVVESDGTLFATAAGAAALDHPAAAVAWLVNQDHRRLRAGDVVISGGLTAPVDLHPGTVVTATFDRIGTVGLRAA